MKAETNVFNISSANGGLIKLSLIVGLVLFFLAFYIIFQEDPASDTGVVQGFFFGGIAYVILCIASIVFHSTVSFVLRKLGKLSLSSFSAVQILFVVGSGTILVYQFLEGPLIDLVLIGLACLTLGCNLLAGYIFWFFGLRRHSGRS